VRKFNAESERTKRARDCKRPPAGAPAATQTKNRSDMICADGERAGIPMGFFNLDSERAAKSFR